MSDRHSAQIRIGGTIDRTTDSKADPKESALDMMIGMINEAGVSDEYGGHRTEIPVNQGAVFGENDSKLLQYLDDDGECLQFRDDQAINGEFEDLEDFLRENDIPYNRWSCAYGGWSAEDVYWVPGMENPLTIFGDDHGTDYVSRDAVLAVLDVLKNDGVSFPERINKAVTDLKVLCPDTPEIPPFKIVGEKA